MAENSLPQAGLGTGSTATTALIGVLSSLAGFLSKDLQDAFIHLIPYISPFLSWGAIWLYNRFVVPPEMASVGGKLNRDLKYLRGCLKDPYLSKKAKVEMRKEYDDTKKMLARLGRDYNSGAFSQTPSTPS